MYKRQIVIIALYFYSHTKIGGGRFLGEINWHVILAIGILAFARFYIVHQQNSHETNAKLKNTSDSDEKSFSKSQALARFMKILFFLAIIFSLVYMTQCTSKWINDSKQIFG